MMEDPAVAVTTAASGSPKVHSSQSTTAASGRQAREPFVEPVVAVHHLRRPQIRNWRTVLTTYQDARDVNRPAGKVVAGQAALDREPSCLERAAASELGHAAPASQRP
jgi:hypothetical protein